MNQKDIETLAIALPETHCRTLRAACSFAEPPAEKVV